MGNRDSVRRESEVLWEVFCVKEILEDLDSIFLVYRELSACLHEKSKGNNLLLHVPLPLKVMERA